MSKQERVREVLMDNDVAEYGDVIVDELIEAMEAIQ